MRRGDRVAGYLPNIPEAAIALEETFVLEACAAAGLQVRRIRRGEWWNGKADDQDVITAGR